MIGSCNCPITLFDYNFVSKIQQCTDASITFEEIVIVMIKSDSQLAKKFKRVICEHFVSLPRSQTSLSCF